MSESNNNIPMRITQLEEATEYPEGSYFPIAKAGYGTKKINTKVLTPADEILKKNFNQQIEGFDFSQSGTGSGNHSYDIDLFEGITYKYTNLSTQPQTLILFSDSGNTTISNNLQGGESVEFTPTKYYNKIGGWFVADSFSFTVEGTGMKNEIDEINSKIDSISGELIQGVSITQSKSGGQRETKYFDIDLIKDFKYSYTNLTGASQTLIIRNSSSDSKTLSNNLQPDETIVFVPDKNYSQFGGWFEPANVTVTVTGESLLKRVNELEERPNTRTALTGGCLTCCGDSITEGVQLENLESGDPYTPRTGAKKPTFGYFIAELNGMSWDNLGYSGSTLTNITCAGEGFRGFTKPTTGRLYNLPSDTTHFIVQFGNNDQYYGPISKREEWLYNTYGETIYWPKNQSQIGAEGYATQAQCDACNAIHGDYATSDEYFQHEFLGSIDNNTDIKTYYGAWNVALSYIIENFPLSKILIMSAYNEPNWIAEADKAIALKWGVSYLCLFDDYENMIYKQKTPTNAMIENVSLAQFRINQLTTDGTHQNLNGMKYMFPRINQKLASL